MRALLLAALLGLPIPALAAVTCPDRLPEDGAPAPFERLGLGGGRGLRSPLQEAWLVYGGPGDEMRAAPATSAPDESRGTASRFTNSWALEPRERMLLVCIYGAGIWLRTPLPDGTRRCVQTGDAGRMTMRCE